MTGTPAMLRGLLHPAWGPLVRVRLRHPGGEGTDGLAILDTGASMSCVDQTAARDLQLDTPGAATWFAVSEAGGRAASALRRGQLQLHGDARLWELDLIEVPGLHDRVHGFRAVALLGWDFLQTCQLHIDGPAGTWALGLPPVRRATRRR